jgi:hypothetical protein
MLNAISDCKHNFCDRLPKSKNLRIVIEEVLTTHFSNKQLTGEGCLRL